MFKLSRFDWIKAISPLALTATIFLGTETAAKAMPYISIYSGRDDTEYYYRQRRVNAPPSLNITPPPGRHIPLPNYSRSRYYPRHHGYRDRYYRHHHGYRDRYYRHHNRKRRHYDRGYRGYKRVIIINPHRRY